jgi:hypothetical protein
MPRVRTLTPGASPIHFFGSEVRRAREAAGMPQAELGALVPRDKSVVSRIEAGLLQADEAFARACDVAFEHLDGFFTRFWKDCQTWGAAFPAAFREFAAYEAEAVTMWTFQHSLVPGLLQTEGYARAVLERHPNVTTEQVAERLAARLARQSVLERTYPPLLWVLLDENVLHRHVGGATMMQDQMTHLAAMARRPNITVQLIPREESHVGLTGDDLTIRRIPPRAGSPTGLIGPVIDNSGHHRNCTCHAATAIRHFRIRFPSLEGIWPWPAR